MRGRPKLPMQLASRSPLSIRVAGVAAPSRARSLLLDTLAPLRLFAAGGSALGESAGSSLGCAPRPGRVRSDVRLLSHHSSVCVHELLVEMAHPLDDRLHVFFRREEGRAEVPRAGLLPESRAGHHDDAGRLEQLQRVEYVGHLPYKEALFLRGGRGAGHRSRFASKFHGSVRSRRRRAVTLPAASAAATALGGRVSEGKTYLPH